MYLLIASNNWNIVIMYLTLLWLMSYEIELKGDLLFK